MRTLTFLLVGLTAAPTALAHGGRHDHGPKRPEACAPAEIRVSTPDNSWYDLYLDGREVASVRGFSDRQERITLPAGRHVLQVTDFMGDSWSRSSVNIACGEVLIAEVRDERGLRVLSRFGAQRTEPKAGRHGHADRHHARPRYCEAGKLIVEPIDDAWFDLYLDGEKVIRSRNFASTEVLEGLAPGRHVLRVTDFMGNPLDHKVIEVGCNTQIYTMVSDRGMRVM